MRLLKSRDERIRIKALEILHEWEKDERKGCEACKQRQADAIASEIIVTHATAEQKQALRGTVSA